MSVNQIVPTPFLLAESDVYQVLHKATIAAMKLRLKVTPGKWVEKLENGETELFKSSDAMEVFANKRHSLEKLERYAMKNIEIFEREFGKKDKKIKLLEDQLKKNGGNRESKVDIRVTQQEANRALEVSRPSKDNENTDEEARGAENQPPNAPSDLENRNEAEVKKAEEERMKKEEMEKKNEENNKEGAENSNAGPPNKKEGEKKKKKVPTVSTVTRRSQRLNVPQQADTAEEKRGEDMVPENADLSMVEDEGMEMEGGEEVKRDNKVYGKEMRKTFTKDNRKQIVAYADDLAWLEYFPMEKLQGARYKWLSG
ncbi:hypothetical protein PRIPAC_97005 [Pristionchus pacificus]|nr:hypothetical protein PRIPAC_97005 [Pristionchus pacificus]|eukprot:PDM81821.1 hypothetical protein PRIPAC_33975 [Pristionchus pacificus]